MKKMINEMDQDADALDQGECVEDYEMKLWDLINGQLYY